MRAPILLLLLSLLTIPGFDSFAQNRLSDTKLRQNLSAAHDGNMNAQYLVGMHYLSLSKSGTYQKTARKWLKRSADQGKAEAQYELAKDIFRDRSREGDQIAFDYFEKASKQGHMKAAIELAKMYYYGFGTLKYLNRAYDLFEIGSKAGDAEAQYFAAKMLLIGEGTALNPEKAFELCKKSSEQDFAASQLLLAQMYLDGSGTAVNKEKAAEIVRKAHEGGNADAEAFWDQNKLWQYTQ